MIGVLLLIAAMNAVPHINADLNKYASNPNISIVVQQINGPIIYQQNQDVISFANSTYKLLPIMLASESDPTTNMCYEDSSDYEPGYFDPPGCTDLDTLMYRAGIWSDNISGHMLTRFIGGPEAENKFAQQLGCDANGAQFYLPNYTTASCLNKVAQELYKTQYKNSYKYLQNRPAPPIGIAAANNPKSVITIDKTGYGYQDTMLQTALVLDPIMPYTISVIIRGQTTDDWSIVQDIATRVSAAQN